MSDERVGSRREFFSGICSNMIDRAQEQLHEWTHSRSEPDEVTRNPSEIMLGKISDFPVNEVIVLEQFKIQIVSESVGLKASDPVSQKCFALRLDAHGKIWMDRSQRWEPEAVLCLMTGEKRTV